MTTRPITSTRRFDLDWLRVLAILLVFVFHSGRFFDTGGWHVKSATTYFGVQIWTTFLANWMMPLIFVISGASLFYALARRGAWPFVRDRVLRLVVPLVVGIFTHVAWQVYLERVTHGQFYGSFIDFLPHYFEGLYGYGGNFAWMGLHLWYLEIVFIFSVALLPLFIWLRRGSGQRWLAQAGDWLAAPGAIYALALPVMLLLCLLDPNSVLGRRDFGGWSLVIDVFFLMYGFLLISHEALQASIRRQRWLSLAGGILCMASLLWLWARQGDPAFGTPRYVEVFSIFGLASWCWILAVMGFGMQHLDRPAPWLNAANEAVLPFYVMHQTVLLTIGFYVLRWPLPDLLKWAVIATTSFAICVGLYQFLVRPANFMRFLFGMKRAPRPAPLQRPTALPVNR